MVAPHLLLLFSSFLLCAFSSWVCHVSVWRSILHGFDQGDPGRTLRAERDAHAFAHFHESRLFLHIPSFIPCNTHPFIVRVYRCDVINVFSQVHAKKFGSISDIEFMFYTYIYICKYMHTLHHKWSSKCNCELAQKGNSTIEANRSSKKILGTALFKLWQICSAQTLSGTSGMIAHLCKFQSAT